MCGDKDFGLLTVGADALCDENDPDTREPLENRKIALRRRQP
jgi:hypothetical protein